MHPDDSFRPRRRRHIQRQRMHMHGSSAVFPQGFEQEKCIKILERQKKIRPQIELGSGLNESKTKKKNPLNEKWNPKWIQIHESFPQLCVCMTACMCVCRGSQLLCFYGCFIFCWQAAGELCRVVKYDFADANLAAKDKNGCHYKLSGCMLRFVPVMSWVFTLCFAEWGTEACDVKASGLFIHFKKKFLWH